MHTVELLEQAIDLTRRLGYQIREEWLGGSGGGGCELKGKKILFLDLALGPEDQLEQIVETLRLEPQATGMPMAHQLRELLQHRQSA